MTCIFGFCKKTVNVRTGKGKIPGAPPPKIYFLGGGDFYD